MFECSVTEKPSSDLRSKDSRFKELTMTGARHVHYGFWGCSLWLLRMFIMAFGDVTCTT